MNDLSFRPSSKLAEHAPNPIPQVDHLCFPRWSWRQPKLITDAAQADHGAYTILSRLLSKLLSTCGLPMLITVDNQEYHGCLTIQADHG